MNTNINVIQKDDIYEVSFRYDPMVVSIVREIYGRKYIPERKIWTIPSGSLGYLINAFKGSDYEKCLNIVSNEEIDVNKTLDSTSIIPDTDISKVHRYVKEGSTLYQHQLDFLKYAIHRQDVGMMSGMILADEPGLGKAVTMDTKIYTPSGYKVMRDIRVGDEVFDELGNIVEVLATYYHKKLNMYRVTFDDGTYVDCCSSHLWTICSENGDFTLKMKDILNKKLKWKDNITKCWLPSVEPVPFDRKEVSIDPWLFGILLCKGKFYTRCIELITDDDCIINEIYNKVPHGYFVTGIRNKYQMLKKDLDGEDFDLYEYINSLELNLPLEERFIPDVYRYNSIENRWALLQGLMDSNGYRHVFRTDSEKLSKDVVELVESLGGYCHVNHNFNHYYVKIRFHNYDKLYGVSENRCSYKNDYDKEPKKYFKSIEFIGKFPGKCITVSSENSLYLCNDFIPTHNTIESMNLALYNKSRYGFKRCLIICCVNAAKYHWKRDISDHTNGKYDPYILGTRISKRTGLENYQTSTKDKLEDLLTLKMYGNKKGKQLPYFIITNIESLRLSEGKKRLMTDAIIDLINRGEISMIIIDEVHKNMSPSSIQGKQIDKIKKSTKDKVEWIPMTGTPIVNRPTDVYLPLKLVGGHNYNSFYTWSQEFCLYGGFGGKEIVGYKNISKLKNCLQYNMIRRKKDDVLDLPSKIFKTEYVENTSYQNKMYEEIRTGMIENKDIIVSSLNPLAQFTRLRQVNECPEVIDEGLKIDSKYLSKNAKMKRILEILEDIKEQNEKVIVFSNWVKPLETLYHLINKKYGVCCFTGNMSEKEREQHKQKFINDTKYTVMLGTIGAMGTMHTFTVAKNAIFLDLPWTMADFEQACDRIHRIGTKSSVNIYKMITKGTIDERIDDIIYQKSGISNYIVDNVDIHGNPELFDLLLGV